MEYIMPKSTFNKIIAISALALVSYSGVATAQEVPNLIGTWTGNIVGGALSGALNHSPEQNEPVFADRAKEWTLTIE